MEGQWTSRQDGPNLVGANMCVQDILKNLCGVPYIKTRISCKFVCETLRCCERCAF